MDSNGTFLDEATLLYHMTIKRHFSGLGTVNTEVRGGGTDQGAVDGIFIKDDVLGERHSCTEALGEKKAPLVSFDCSNPPTKIRGRKAIRK